MFAKNFGYLGILAPGLVVIATITYVLLGPTFRRELSQLLRSAELFSSRHRAAARASTYPASRCFGG